jgi:GTPase SAR1 family protein
VNGFPDSHWFLKVVCVFIDRHQARMRSIWEKYFDSAHGVVFVVDSSDENRFVEARHVLGEVY